MIRIFSCFTKPSKSKSEWISDDDTQAQDAGEDRDNASSYKGTNTEIELSHDEGSHFQDDLWRRASRDKAHALRLTICDANINTFDSSLEHLSVLYKRHGLTTKLPVVHLILQAMQPFTAGITSLTQAYPEVASLAWGSIQLVFQSVVNFVGVFDRIGQTLLNLSTSLPRFVNFAELLPTPRLHSALREVYSIFLDFNSAVIKLLRKSVLIAFFKVNFGSLGSVISRNQQALDRAKQNFEEERKLAALIIQDERHLQIMSSLDTKRTVTTLPSARNVMFTGREDVLQQLHSSLILSCTNTDAAKRQRQSCVLHSIGGMGKTEIALEYTYRFGEAYDYIFWVHAENDATLSSSFLDITSKVLPDDRSPDNPRKIKMTLDWLRDADKPWLIIFDNVEDASSLRKYWPAGQLGAILVTTQNSGLVTLAKAAIQVKPMSPAEGSALIQHFLRRGGSEQSAAEALSDDLGGIPLAISHLAGYVARTQCTIDQIRENYRDRYKSSQIFMSASPATTSEYAHTLDTVWDLAWNRLSDDARTLLEHLAFLNPDAVPERLFLGPGITLETNPEADSKGWRLWHGLRLQDSPTEEGKYWQFWEHYRYSQAIAVLRERHLIEQDVSDTGVSLRIHRTLQRSIQHRLDKDTRNRQRVFERVVNMVQQQYPRKAIQRRGDNSFAELVQVYSPHVVAMEGAYRQSKTKITDNLDFAALLITAGVHALENAAQPVGQILLETAFQITESLIEAGDLTVRRLFVRSMSNLQLYNQYKGNEGRFKALAMTQKELDVIDEEFSSLPLDQWTLYEHMQLGNIHIDRGMALAQANRIEEAGQHFDISLACYESASSEKDIPSRFAMTWSFQMWHHATEGHVSHVEKWAKRTEELILSTFGLENDLSLTLLFAVAISLFTIGDIAQAFRLHHIIYNTRLRLYGSDSHITLASQYNLAVCYVNLGDLEQAESLLRDNIQSSTTAQWRAEDIDRSQYRLAVLLRTQGREREADGLRAKARTSRNGQAATPKVVITPDTTDFDAMGLFDADVTLWHGRTAGIWSNGKIW